MSFINHWFRKTSIGCMVVYVGMATVMNGVYPKPFILGISCERGRMHLRS